MNKFSFVQVLTYCYKVVGLTYEYKDVNKIEGINYKSAYIDQNRGEVNMWIARDKDGQLTLFSHKPHRCTDVGWDNESWDVVSMDEFTDAMILDSNMFPDLTWEDEPIEVELTVK